VVLDPIAAGQTSEVNTGSAICGRIDKQVMDDAYYIPVPGCQSLLYRPPGLMNVWVNPAYNREYGYLPLSVK
jgi:hypothetical protein